jgi:exodeoxyribonuclease-3
VRIVSWNINSLRRRQERLLAWLAQTQPDVVCLQETKCTDEQFPADALRNAGYHCAFHGQKSYNGVAIFRRSSRGCAAALCDEEEDPQARVIAATIGSVRVFSVYAPNGQAVGSPAYEYKLKWYERLQRCLREHEASASELAVCGDFNVAPRDEDVHDPELWRGAIMCSDGERAAFESLCEAGLIDTLRLHRKERGSSRGGITGCFRSRRTRGCGLMRCSRAVRWPRVARTPGSIARCGKARNLPITRRSGRSSSCSERAALAFFKRSSAKRCLLRVDAATRLQWTRGVARWTFRRHA